MCAGSGKRWGFHKPKQLSLVEGVPNLIRTIEMIKRTGYEDIWITVSEDKKHYFPPELNLLIGNNKYETQRYSNGFPLVGETVYLYGDVIYNEPDLNSILFSRHNTTWFGRLGPNPITGKNHGELMGVHVIDTKRFEEAVSETNRQFKEGERKMCIGWDVLEIHEGVNRMKATNFVSLSNYSDDFDDIKEYKHLLKVYDL